VGKVVRTIKGHADFGILGIAQAACVSFEQVLMSRSRRDEFVGFDLGVNLGVDLGAKLGDNAGTAAMS